VKQLTIIVKPFRTEPVLRAIQALGVDPCIVREVKGYSRQKGYLDRYVGSEYSVAFLPKVEIAVWVHDSRARDVAEKLAHAARTGRMGDGKILVIDVPIQAITF
jgi:nitrogen regulatory protein PII